MRALINFLVALFLFAGSPSSFAQERPHVPRVGYLGIGRAAPPPVFVQKMREQAYVDGQTASFEYRFAEGRRERLLPLANSSWRPASTSSSPSATRRSWRRRSNQDYPHLMVACDAVTTGFVASCPAWWQYDRRHLHHQ